jgi:hypothetical protein
MSSFIPVHTKGAPVSPLLEPIIKVRHAQLIEGPWIRPGLPARIDDLYFVYRKKKKKKNYNRRFAIFPTDVAEYVPFGVFSDAFPDPEMQLHLVSLDTAASQPSMVVIYVWPI